MSIRRRQHLRQRVRGALQSFEHRQRALPVALHADRQPDPHRRSQLPVGEGEWRRHRRRAGRPARRQSGRRHRDAEAVRQSPAPPAAAARSAIWRGIPFFGRDLNGDGDRLDTVRLLAPSQTATHRWGLNASLRYEINDDHVVRIAYAFDRGRHRQTGETGFLQPNGEPFDVFPVNDPVAAGERRHPPEARPPLDRAPPPDFGRVSRRILRRPPDRQCRRARAFLHPRSQQLLRDLERQRLRRMLRRQHGRPRLLSGDEHGQYRRRRPRHSAGPAAPRVPLQCGAAEYRRHLRSHAAALALCQLFARPAGAEHRLPLQQLLLSGGHGAGRCPSRKRPTISTSASAIGPARSRSSSPPGTRSSRIVWLRPSIRISTRTCSATSARSTATASTPASTIGRSPSFRSTSSARISGRTSRTTCWPASARRRCTATCPAGSAGTPIFAADRGPPRIGRPGLHVRRPRPGPDRPARARRPGQADRSALRQRRQSAADIVHGRVPQRRYGLHRRRRLASTSSAPGRRPSPPSISTRGCRSASSASTTTAICRSTSPTCSTSSTRRTSAARC